MKIRRNWLQRITFLRQPIYKTFTCLLMDQFTDLNIFLYTGYTPRANALKDRVEKACNSQSSVILIENGDSIIENANKQSSSVVILDLPNIKQSAIKTVKSVKEVAAHCKLLAIHIYTSRLLIDPLFEAGIDGYLMYEPTPDQLQKSIMAVLNDQTYLPDQIVS